MKRPYLYILLIVLSVTAFTGCNSEEDNLVVTQRTNIESYLDRNAPEDWTEVGGVYRHRVPASRSGSTGDPITKGDEVLFRFAAYQFTTTRQEPAFYTNIPEIITELKDSGINTVHFPVGSEAAVIGSGKLIKPLDTGLTGCYKGDSVSLFITSNMAYGANWVGATLPRDSAVEYVIMIEDVIKQ